MEKSLEWIMWTRTSAHQATGENDGSEVERRGRGRRKKGKGGGGGDSWPSCGDHYHKYKAQFPPYGPTRDGRCIKCCGRAVIICQNRSAGGLKAARSSADYDVADLDGMTLGIQGPRPDLGRKSHARRLRGPWNFVCFGAVDEACAPRHKRPFPH